MNNKLRLIAISVLTNCIVAGVLSQLSFLIAPLDSSSFNFVLAYFMFLAGLLVGVILTIFDIEANGLQKLMRKNTGVITVCLFSLYFIEHPWVVLVAITPLGIFCGKGMCHVGVIIITAWQDKIRSVLLVAQGGIIYLALTVFWFMQHDIQNEVIFTQRMVMMMGVAAIITLGLIMVNRDAFCELQNNIPPKLTRSEWNFGILSSGAAIFLKTVAMGMLILFFSGAELMDSVQTGTDEILPDNRDLVIALGSLLFFTVALLLVRIYYVTLLTTLLLLLITGLSLYYAFISYVFISDTVLYLLLAYGVACVKTPSIRHLVYLFLCGAAGVFTGLIISLIIVTQLPQQAVLWIILAIYLLVVALLVASSRWRNVTHRQPV